MTLNFATADAVATSLCLELEFEHLIEDACQVARIALWRSAEQVSTRTDAIDFARTSMLDMRIAVLELLVNDNADGFTRVSYREGDANSTGDNPEGEE